MQIKRWTPPQTPDHQKTHHVFVVDVSGSMYRELEKMRLYLKNNLSTLVSESDIVSILYFSGKGDFGVVFEALSVNSAKTLSQAQEAIDRFLKVIGLTGFTEPLQLASDVVKRNSDGYVNNLIFMSDGYDNVGSKKTILDVCSQIGSDFDHLTFMEYGWYADRDMLISMAENAGGQHVFVKDHELYTTEFENAITNGVATTQQYDVSASVKNVVYLYDNAVYILTPIDGSVRLPLYVCEVFEVEDHDIKPNMTGDELYLAMYLAAKRGDSDRVWEVLKITGDVRLIKMYNNCFTKQEVIDFLKVVNDAIFNSSLRCLEGSNPNMIPRDDAFTIIDLCELLISGENFLHTGSPEFKYNKIGRATTQVAIEDEVGDTFTPKFVPEDVDGLVALNNIVMHESRPNISINTVQDGYVGIPSDLADEHGVPKKVKTHQYRNYTLVKDGIINLEYLPVVLDDETLKAFIDIAVVEGINYKVHPKNPNKLVIQLVGIPLINRNMIKGVAAESHFNMVLDLNYIKARQKVLKYLRDINFGVPNAVGLAAQHGKDAADWLSSIGIRDYGFSPKVEAVEATDFYLSRELVVKIKGLSSLPSVAAVVKKVNDGKKLNIADTFINMHLTEVSSEIAGMTYDELAEYFNTQAFQAISWVRNMMGMLNRIVYGIIVGKKWFTDMPDTETGTLVIDRYGFKTQISAAVESKEIKI